METAAQKARREAEEARKRQDDESAKAKLAAEAKDRDAAEAGAGGKAGDGGGDASDAAVDAGLSPPRDPAALDVGALMARLDAQERLIKTLSAQSAGGVGPSTSEAKDTTSAGPGAAFDPRLTRTMGSGVTSGPDRQPHPSSGAEISAPTKPGQFDWEDGETTVWGRRSDGSVIRPRRYPVVTETDVLVIATGYYEDAVKNAGEIIRNYSGPFASWMDALDDRDKVIPRERFLRSLAAEEARASKEAAEAA